jgi:hypothetical protein
MYLKNAYKSGAFWLQFKVVIFFVDLFFWIGIFGVNIYF